VLIGSCSLAFGPWLVRLSGTGPVAAGFWRLALALPFLFVIAAMTRQAVHWPGRKLALLVAAAAFFFAADLALWHVGIHLTKLGNSTLFGNLSSFAFAGWGLWLARQWPSRTQGLAIGLAALGAALLMGSSFELSPRNFAGDILCLLAGLLYTGYLIAVQKGRGSLKPLPLLFLSSLFGAAMLLPISLIAGEQIIPNDWTYVFLLALGSQVIGQGLLVYGIVPDRFMRWADSELRWRSDAYGIPTGPLHLGNHGRRPHRCRPLREVEAPLDLFRLVGFGPCIRQDKPAD